MLGKVPAAHSVRVVLPAMGLIHDPARLRVEIDVTGARKRQSGERGLADLTPDRIIVTVLQ